MEKPGASPAQLPKPEAVLKATSLPLCQPAVDFHSIGDTSPLCRQCVGLVQSAAYFALQTASFALTALALVLIFPRRVEQLNAMSRSYEISLLLYMAVLLAPLTNFYCSTFLLWLFKTILLGRFRDGLHPVWGWKMACFRVLCACEEELHSGFFLSTFQRTEIPNLCRRILGARIGALLRGAGLNIAFLFFRVPYPHYNPIRPMRILFTEPPNPAQ